ncbi:hypothetical protein R3P38DRAFT_2768427 [Favolaschia claudopus]|uniref:Uncharacterized protein n=1 Tax=Favolaschia claudopus TaxID=2862362 RepID=A0AAW0CQL7_9AGAR
MISNYPTDYAETGLSLWAGILTFVYRKLGSTDSDLKQERMSGIVVGWKHCQGKVKTKVFKIVAGHCEMESTGDTSWQRVQPNSEPPYILTGSRARNSTQALKLEGNLSKAGHTKLPDFVHNSGERLLRIPGGIITAFESPDVRKYHERMCEETQRQWMATLQRAEKNLGQEYEYRGSKAVPRLRTISSYFDKTAPYISVARRVQQAKPENAV